MRHMSNDLIYENSSKGSNVVTEVTYAYNNDVLICSPLVYVLFVYFAP